MSQLQKDSKTSRFVFAKGAVEFKGLSITAGLWNNDKNDAYIDVRGGMEFIMTDCTMVSVFRVGGGTGNHRTYIQSGVKYYSYSTETGVKTDISETNEKFLHHNYGTSHLYTWDVVEVKMMVEGAEVTKTVRVCNYTTHAAGTYQSAAACSAAPQLPADAVVTATETTQEMGALGTFTQGTYVDGEGTTQTVWYQIVE